MESLLPLRRAGSRVRPRCHAGGVVFLNNRYHDPTLGHFTTVDPLVGKTGQPYLYGDGNPTTLSDPSGLCADTNGTRAKCLADKAVAAAEERVRNSAAHLLVDLGQGSTAELGAYESPALGYGSHVDFFNALISTERGFGLLGDSEEVCPPEHGCVLSVRLDGYDEVFDIGADPNWKQAIDGGEVLARDSCGMIPLCSEAATLSGWQIIGTAKDAESIFTDGEVVLSTTANFTAIVWTDPQNNGEYEIAGYQQFSVPMVFSGSDGNSPFTDPGSINIPNAGAWALIGGPALRQYHDGGPQ